MDEERLHAGGADSADAASQESNVGQESFVVEQFAPSDEPCRGKANHSFVMPTGCVDHPEGSQQIACGSVRKMSAGWGAAGGFARSLASAPARVTQDDKLHFAVFESKDCKGPVSVQKSLPAKKGVCYHGEGKDYKQYCRKTRSPESQRPTAAHRRARKAVAHQGSLAAKEASAMPRTEEPATGGLEERPSATGDMQQAHLTMWRSDGCAGAPDKRASLPTGQCVAGKDRDEMLVCQTDRVLRHVFKTGSGCAGKPLHTESRPRSQCVKEGDGASIRVDCAATAGLLRDVDKAFDGAEQPERRPTESAPAEAAGDAEPSSATGAGSAGMEHAAAESAAREPTDPVRRDTEDGDLESADEVESHAKSSSTGSAPEPLPLAERAGAEAVVSVTAFEDGECQAPRQGGEKEVTTDMCLVEPSLRKSFRFVCRHGEPLRRLWFAGSTCAGEAVGGEEVGSKCQPMSGVGSFYAKCRFNREAAEKVVSRVQGPRVVQTTFTGDSCAGLPVRAQGLAPGDCLVNHLDNTSFHIGCAGGGEKVRVSTFEGSQCLGKAIGRFDVSSGTCNDVGGSMATLTCDMDGENDEERAVQKVWEGLSADVTFVHASFRGGRCEGRPRNYGSLSGGCHDTGASSSQEVLCGHGHLVIRDYATPDCTGRALSDYVSPVSDTCVPDGRGGSLLASCSQGALEAGPDTEEELAALAAPAATGPPSASGGAEEDVYRATGATGAATGCEAFTQSLEAEASNGADGTASGGDLLPEWELEVALFSGGPEAPQCRGPTAEVVRVPNGCYMPQGMRGSVQVRCAPDGDLEVIRYASSDCTGTAASVDREETGEACSAQAGGFVRERCVRVDPRPSVATVTTSMYEEGVPCSGPALDSAEVPEGACSRHGVNGSVASSCTRHDGRPAVVRVLFDSADCSGEPSSHSIIGQDECVKDPVTGSYYSATCGAGDDETDTESAELSLAEVASRLAARHGKRLPGSLRGH